MAAVPRRWAAGRNCPPVGNRRTGTPDFLRRYFFLICHILSTNIPKAEPLLLGFFVKNPVFFGKLLGISPRPPVDKPVECVENCRGCEVQNYRILYLCKPYFANFVSLAQYRKKLRKNRISLLKISALSVIIKGTVEFLPRRTLCILPEKYFWR